MNGATRCLRLKIIAAVGVLVPAPVIAQTASSSSFEQTVTTAGRVSESTVGEVGQRQTRFDVAKGIVPTARVASRIQNRVESRIHSRIDLGYDPKIDATSSIEIAEKQARTSDNIKP